MNTSTEARKQLEQALAQAQSATEVINNLVAAHDYQDVAALVTRAGAMLLASGLALMNNDDETALDHIDTAEDLLDNIYDIIGVDIEDED